MGGGSQTTRSTSQVTIPQEIRDRGTSITNQAMDQYMDNPVNRPSYSFGDWSQEGNDRTAGISPYTNLAGQQAVSGTSGYAPYTNAASGTAQGAFSQGGGNNVYASTGASYAPDGTATFNEFNQQNLERYQNPYRQQVLDTGLSEINRQNQMSLNGINDAAARSGAFGGARHGVAEAETNRGFSDTRNQFISSTLNNMYGAGVDQYNRERDALFQQTGINNQNAQQRFGQGMDLAQFYQGQGRDQYGFDTGNTQNLLNVGNTFMGQDQAVRSNAYDSYLQNQDYGLGILERLQALNAMQPTNRTQTSTQTTPGQGFLGPALGAAGSFLSFMSDERVKEDVEIVDPEEALSAFSKIKPKTYKYKDEVSDIAPDMAPKGRRIGFMAQEYEKAFGRSSDDDKIKTVDVPQLMGELVAAVHGLEKRTRKLARK